MQAPNRSGWLQLGWYHSVTLISQSAKCHFLVPQMCSKSSFGKLNYVKRFCFHTARDRSGTYICQQQNQIAFPNAGLGSFNAFSIVCFPSKKIFLTHWLNIILTSKVWIKCIDFCSTAPSTPHHPPAQERCVTISQTDTVPSSKFREF